jgi:predicted MPP superfamily phosphohydrolase
MNKVGLYILLVIWLFIEFYVFTGLKNTISPKLFSWVFLINFIAILIVVVTIISVNRFYDRGISKTIGWINILMGLTVTILVTKMFYIFFLFGEDIYRLGNLVYQYFVGNEKVEMESRRKFVTNSALVLAAIPFSSFIYGVFKGRYNFKVMEETLSFSDLPSEFDGFKIVHISDVHSGSFDSVSAMQKGLDLIQAQKPDIILFTGDLVNNLSLEFTPYIKMFKNLSAPFGKFSILGNHDYGLYVNWSSVEENLQNQKEIRDHHPAMGFDLLNNVNRKIEKNGQSIRLAGVENWGRPPFPPKGDLNKALTNIDSDEFTILMSHDPHHWDDIALKHAKHIHLTLSGHTHGMQMGIDIPSIKWSPIKYRYPRWAGLYNEGNEYLYVNRGFGHLGFPGRVGVMPEITVINLKKK